MNSFFLGLQSLIVTVRRNILSSILTTFMILLIIITYSARENIATFLERNPSPETERVRFGHAIVADGQINEALESVRVKLNADRVLIRQFHNSKADLTGLPFSSISTTYGAFAPGVTLSATSYQPMPLSVLNDQLAMMWPTDGSAPHCVKLSKESVKDISYRKYWDENGIAVAYSCPLINLRGQPVGMIGAGYLTEEKKRPMTDQQMFELLSRTGEKSVGYLEMGTKDKNEPWYVRLFQGGK